MSKSLVRKPYFPPSSAKDMVGFVEDMVIQESLTKPSAFRKFPVGCGKSNKNTKSLAFQEFLVGCGESVVKNNNAKPLYFQKFPKPSAFREFPVGCSKSVYNSNTFGGPKFVKSEERKAGTSSREAQINDLGGKDSTTRNHEEVTTMAGDVSTRNPILFQSTGIGRPDGDSSEVGDQVAAESTPCPHNLSIPHSTGVAARPKLKSFSSLHRVSAVRDFPSGCGEVGPLLITSENHTSYEENPNIRVSAVRDFPSGCGEVGPVLITSENHTSYEENSNFSGDPMRKRKRVKAQHGSISLKMAQDDDFVQNKESRLVSIGSKAVEASNGRNYSLDDAIARKRVEDMLREFRTIHDKVVQEFEFNSKGQVFGIAADYKAYRFYKERNWDCDHVEKYLGSVPGVEVGDEFRRRVEMSIIGLHRELQAGIDYMKQYGKNIAISVVASGRYANGIRYSDVLIYSGSGVPNRDQKLERGNLALKNSMDRQNAIRVIHGVCKNKIKSYVYDGLYKVETFWTTKADGRHISFMFLLRRIGGQPVLTVAGATKSAMLSSAKRTDYMEQTTFHEEFYDPLLLEYPSRC